MAYDARWDSSGIDSNGAGILISGQTDYTVYWGDGTSEPIANNRDDDGDGFPDVAVLFHNYTSDGVYDITVVDDPNDPLTPDVRLRAYMHNNDPDGTVVTGTDLKDMVLTGIGDDSINTGKNNDWVDANAGNDTIDGGAGNDFLIAGEGSDMVRGGLGDDLLFGGFDEATPGAMDRFDGGGGADTIYSGKGVARLTGGTGADFFGFLGVGDSNTTDGVDRIKDFEQGTDKLLLILSASSSTGTLSFIGADRFNGVGGEIRAVNQGGETKVLVDLDGNGAADMRFDLEGGYDLTAGDFFLI